MTNISLHYLPRYTPPTVIPLCPPTVRLSRCDPHIQHGTTAETWGWEDVASAMEWMLGYRGMYCPRLILEKSCLCPNGVLSSGVPGWRVYSHHLDVIWGRNISQSGER